MTATKTVPSNSANSAPETPDPEPKWLTLIEDQNAKVLTFSACMALADLRGDGKHSLVIGEFSHATSDVRLRSLDGQFWRDAFKLTEFPSSVLVINLESSEPGKRTVPAIAVSVANHVLVYKTMKPLCRYLLPPLPPLEEEAKLWKAAKEKAISAPDLHTSLMVLKSTISETLFTQRTLSFLLISPDEREYFVQEYSEKPLGRSSVITCMTTLNKKLKDDSSEQYLVLGTESKYIYIVDAVSNSTKAQHEIPEVPATVVTHGVFHEKYRVFVSCRDGKIYTITKDFPELVCVSPIDRPITLLNTGKHLVVPCMNGVVYYYKGKSHEMAYNCGSPITCAEFIRFESTGIRAVAVAMLNKEVLILKEDQLVDSFLTEEPVVAMKYGKFDREDGGLALVLQNGTVIIKLLRRRAKFDAIIKEIPLRPIDTIIPTKSALFLEQTERETENYKGMNTAIFDNLARMKYQVNKRYAEMLQLDSGNRPARHDLLVTPQLLGSGPFFKILVTIQNMSSEAPLVGYHLYLHRDPLTYELLKTYIQIPFIVPNGRYVVARTLRFIGEQPLQGELTIHVLKDGGTVPVLSVLAVVPQSDVGLA